MDRSAIGVGREVGVEERKWARRKSQARKEVPAYGIIPMIVTENPR
jgi:hypothetical protein